jgi:hypothetical protein
MHKKECLPDGRISDSSLGRGNLYPKDGGAVSKPGAAGLHIDNSFWPKTP